MYGTQCRTCFTASRATGGLDPGGGGIAAEALDARTGPRPEGQPPLDRGTRQPGECQGFGCQRIGGIGVDGQAAPGHQPAEAPRDRGGER
jgi:hypothetical protein